MASNKYEITFSGASIKVTVADMASQVDEWVSEVRSMYHQETMIVGLDCEWKPPLFQSMTNKTATMQLCIGTKCLIVQMFYIDYFPQSIKNFLSDSNVTFVGVEVGDDAVKLRDEYGLVVTRTADIQALAMERWPLRFYRKPGLKKLAHSIVGIVMPKPMHVCRSNWEVRVLSLEQIEYCCIDSYSSYRIGHKLFKEMQ